MMTPEEAWAAVSDGIPTKWALRGNPNRWVRFHSLPEAKRYADTDAEYEEVLQRADEILQATFGERADVLVISTQYLSPGELKADNWKVHRRVMPTAERWMRLPTEVEVDEDEVFETDAELWCNWHTYSRRSLDALIRVVADFELASVIVLCPERKSAVAPDDGGIDVVLATVDDREVLAERFAEWLPSDQADDESDRLRP